ncbi:hypothetical protein [Glutamicibacter sp. PS]|uniref:hypothetical protein n=1 Tax=Glutamicibacter sp. PS TaxID=3075634 RepID=UPI0028504781|nr:hypothetical protein [Glutamicibacter sp. PS]MDR4533326.1 hypothetical protein [Glutamicibacter sp. PS]
MKKILGTIMLAVLAALTMVGCANVDAQINIKNADSASAQVKVTADKSLVDGASFDELTTPSGVPLSQILTVEDDEWSIAKVDTPDEVGLEFSTIGTLNLVQLQDALSNLLGVDAQLVSEGEDIKFSMPGIADALGGGVLSSGHLSVTYSGHVVSHSATGVQEHNTVTFDLLQPTAEYQVTGTASHALFYSAVFGGALLVLTFIFALAFAPKGVKEHTH